MTTKPRGRKPDANSKSGKIRDLLKTGMSAADIAKKLKCTPGLVYNVKAKANGGGAKRRGPGRPPKNATAGASAGDGISQSLAAVKGAEQQRVQLRGVLERIQAVIRDVLA